MAAAARVVGVERVERVEPQQPAEIGELGIDRPPEIGFDARMVRLLDRAGEPGGRERRRQFAIERIGGFPDANTAGTRADTYSASANTSDFPVRVISASIRA